MYELQQSERLIVGYLVCIFIGDYKYVQNSRTWGITGENKSDFIFILLTGKNTYYLKLFQKKKNILKKKKI